MKTITYDIRRVDCVLDLVRRHVDEKYGDKFPTFLKETFILTGIGGVEASHEWLIRQGYVPKLEHLLTSKNETGTVKYMHEDYKTFSDITICHMSVFDNLSLNAHIMHDTMYPTSSYRFDVYVCGIPSFIFMPNIAEE